MREFALAYSGSEFTSTSNCNIRNMRSLPSERWKVTSWRDSSRAR